MQTEIKVPAFPESVTDGTLVTWHIKASDSVQQDQLLAEIETDKVVFELRALKPGVIDDLLVKENDSVVSEQVVAHITEGKVIPRPSTDTDENIQEETSIKTNTIKMTPSAEKMIMENQLDRVTITGSGKKGLILKEDVLKYIERQLAQAEKPPTQDSLLVPEGERLQKRVPMSRLRLKIAERLLSAQHNAAILTTFNEIDMQPIMNLRNKYKDRFKDKHDVKLGFMSFFILAVVEALKRFPEINASVEGTDIVYHGFIDIGIAVGSPRGLVVPVIRDADTLSMAEIEKNITRFGERAKTGTLSIDDITGGTFSISNGGVFGSMLSTPIINPPQSAILGMHKIEKRPVVINDEIVIRPMMYAALSYDHRLIDGREAVQFLVTIKDIIEDSNRLLLEV